MKKLSSIILIVFFAGILLFLPIQTLARDKEDFSVFENRTLASQPEFTGNALMSGSYFADWDTYLSDHLYLRDDMLTLYTRANMDLLGKTIVNDVVIQDDLLLPYQRRYDIVWGGYFENIENTAEVISRVNEYVNERGGNFLFVGIPEQGSIFRSRHPYGSYNPDEYLSVIETSMFEALDARDVPYLNMMETLKQDADRYYSAIDHHFNYYGALKTCQAILERLNERSGLELKVYSEDDLIIEPYDGIFHGSRSIKLYNQYPTDEKLYVGYTDIPFSRIDYDTTEYGTLYHKPYYTGDYVFYTLYMGGDCGKTVISTDRPELPTVLMWGDSFTNAMETIMYLSFDKAIYMDFRHDRSKTIYSCIDEYEPDVVIYVTNDTAYTARHENIVSIEG